MGQKYGERGTVYLKSTKSNQGLFGVKKGTGCHGLGLRQGRLPSGCFYEFWATNKEGLLKLAWQMDRLTQLQDQVNLLAEKFGTYTGVLQRDAPPVPLEEGAPLHKRPVAPLPDGTFPPPPQPMETIIASSVDMAQHIAENVRVIDELIDSLPGIKSTKPEQLATIDRLEEENQRLAKELQNTMHAAEDALKLIQAALLEIYTDRLNSHDNNENRMN